jgi:hypothetical protein
LKGHAKYGENSAVYVGFGYVPTSGRSMTVGQLLGYAYAAETPLSASNSRLTAG